MDAYRILLDNFDFANEKRLWNLIGITSLTETSGNINEIRLRNMLSCGGFISFLEF
jgi:nicotinate-nucleotide pyrophosphorylase (carboxylating)